MKAHHKVKADFSWLCPRWMCIITADVCLNKLIRHAVAAKHKRRPRSLRSEVNHSLLPVGQLRGNYNHPFSSINHSFCGVDCIVSFVGTSRGCFYNVPCREESYNLYLIIIVMWWCALPIVSRSSELLCMANRRNSRFHIWVYWLCSQIRVNVAIWFLILIQVAIRRMPFSRKFKNVQRPHHNQEDLCASNNCVMLIENKNAEINS